MRNSALNDVCFRCYFVPLERIIKSKKWLKTKINTILAQFLKKQKIR